MRFSAKNWVYSVAFWLLATSFTRGDETQLTVASPVDVRGWIEQLNDDDFATRESAAVALSQVGSPAINALSQGVMSDSPEVSWRCGELLERLATEGDEATADRVAHLLLELSKRGKPALAAIASELRERQLNYRHNRAASEIRKLGGKIAGFDDELDEGLADMPFAVEIVEVEEDFAVAVAMAAPEHSGFLSPPQQAIGLFSWWDGGSHEGAAVGSIVPSWAITVGERLVRGLLPGRAGESLRNGLAKTNNAYADTKLELTFNEICAATAMDLAPDKNDRVTSFDLPPLSSDEDGNDPEFDDMPIEDIFPGEDILDAADMEILDFDFVAAPLFVAGIMPAEGDMPAGMLMLDAAWKGGEAGLQHVGGLRQVASVQIDHAPLTDAALHAFAKIPSLQHLQIRGGKFSKDAMRAFHRDRPNVSIMSVGDGMLGVNSSQGGEGCVLDMVSPGTAAEAAGLKVGDVVVSIDGDAILDFSDLTISISTHRAGDRFSIGYRRGDETKETFVTLKKRGPGQ